MKKETWGRLKVDTPFSHIFPDGSVPLVSIVSIIPREQGCPPCYLVKGQALTDEQVEQLALVLAERDPNTEGYPLEELKAYVRQDLPLKTEWFSGVGTSDPAMLFGMLDLDFDVE